VLTLVHHWLADFFTAFVHGELLVQSGDHLSHASFGEPLGTGRAGLLQPRETVGKVAELGLGLRIFLGGRSRALHPRERRVRVRCLAERVAGCRNRRIGFTRSQTQRRKSLANSR
jgi:hypothetical protein